MLTHNCKRIKLKFGYSPRKDRKDGNFNFIFHTQLESSLLYYQTASIQIPHLHWVWKIQAFPLQWLSFRVDPISHYRISKVINFNEWSSSFMGNWQLEYVIECKSFKLDSRPEADSFKWASFSFAYTFFFDPSASSK